MFVFTVALLFGFWLLACCAWFVVFVFLVDSVCLVVLVLLLLCWVGCGLGWCCFDVIFELFISDDADFVWGALWFTFGCFLLVAALFDF